MILALDVSTSILGWALTEHGNSDTLVYGAWDFRNKNTFTCLIDKCEYVKEQLKEFKSKYNITKVIIEQPFTFFSGKNAASSANTMAVLQNFNGVVSWLVYDVLGIKPDYITAMGARSNCGIKIPRGSDAKKCVMQWLLDSEPRFVVQYTSKGNVAPKYYDMMDAIVLLKSQL